MADDFVNGLLQAAEDLVGPLEQAVQSPEDFNAFLGELGWTSPLVNDVANVLSSFPQLFSDIEAALQQLEQGESSGSASPSDIAGWVSDAITAIAALTKAIDDLNASHGLPAPFDDTFWAAFPEELLDYLICRYLARRVPKLYGLLIFAGIVTEEFVEPDPAQAGRVPYLARTVHWDRLPKAATDPVGLFTEVYHWDPNNAAGDDFDAELLLRNIARVLAAYGAPGALEAPSSYLDPYYAPTALLRPYLSELVVPVLTVTDDTGSAIGVATLTLHALPIPPTGTPATPGNVLPSGFVLFPVVEGALASAPLELIEGVTLGVKGEFSSDLIQVEVRPTGADVTTGLTTFDAAVQLDVAPQQPLIMIGTAGSSRFELAKAHIALGAKGPTYGKLEYLVDAGLDSASLVIDLGEGDGFLQKLLGGQPQTLELGFGLKWSSVSGFTFQGQARLAVELPVHLTILDVLTVDTIGIAVGADTSGKLTVEATVSGGLTLGPFDAEVDRIGAKLALEPRVDHSGSLGSFDLGFGFRPPNGVGFEVDAGPVIGGGYVYFDLENEQYAGVLDLEFSGTFALKAIGLLTTKMPDGSKGFSLFLIITAEFPPIQLGYGFTLNGVGGALGANRTMDTGVLSTGIHSGGLESLLFPPDPVAHANEVIANLRAAFPVAEDHFVFGPMAKLGWVDILTLELGILLELPQPIRLVLLGRLSLALPEAGDEAVLLLQLDVLGIIDFGTGDISIDATLFDSHIVDFPLTGDMAVRANVGSHPAFALSAGGFHPKFTPPPNFPTLRRLGITIASGDNPRLLAQCYFAVTSNTAQMGAGIDAYAAADLGVLGTFSVQAGLAFDALFHFVPFSVEAVLDGMASLKHNGDDMAAVKIHLEFSGPTPWRAIGTATIEFWGSHDLHVELTVGNDAPAPAPAPADPGHLLLDALAKSDAWGSVPPDQDHSLVTLRDPAAGTAVLVHPLGELSVHQRVVPLGVQIQRIGTSPVPGGATLTISDVTVTGATTSGLTSLDDDFAPAQFFDLSDDDKLSRPAFESLTAGARVQTSGFAAGGSQSADMSYETVTVDDRTLAPTLDLSYAPAADKLLVMAEHGAAAGSKLTPAPRFVAASQGISTSKPGYVVAARDDLTVLSGSQATSYSEAADALAAHEAATPQDAGRYHVVASHEAA
jgi:hypothetical protein